MAQPAYVPAASVVPYTPADEANWSPSPGSTSTALDQLAARPIGTLVQVQGSSNASDVGVAATSTPIGVGLSVTVDGTQTIEVSAVACFTNVSEALAQPANVTLGLLVNGVGPPVTQDQFAAGETACTVAYLVGPLLLAAGTYTAILVATASSGAGNCVIPAQLGRIIVRRYGS